MARTNKHLGDLVVTEPGATVEDLEIEGRVIIRAPGVTIRDCTIHGYLRPSVPWLRETFPPPATPH